jgi:hypothetical protein
MAVRMAAKMAVKMDLQMDVQMVDLRGADWADLRVGETVAQLDKQRVVWTVCQRVA